MKDKKEKIHFIDLSRQFLIDSIIMDMNRFKYTNCEDKVIVSRYNEALDHVITKINLLRLKIYNKED